MEFFIDSADIEEIKNSVKLGIIHGVTTNPTFLVRYGIKDVDKSLLEMCNIKKDFMVHAEAMGRNANEIVKESIRLNKIHKNIVMKIPMNWDGIKAAEKLKKKGIKTNLHLIFSVNQALLAAEGGASYVCPLVGRLYDKGHDGMELIRDIRTVLDKNGYDTKIMVSSVRHPDHVKQASLIGADAITIPFYVLKLLVNHPLSDIGLKKFSYDMNKTLLRATDIVTRNPIIREDKPVKDALVIMTSKKIGAISVVNNNGELVGIFTDGDLRRKIEKEDILEFPMSKVMTKNPISIGKNEKAVEIAKISDKRKIVNIIVTNDDNKPVGMIIVHDLFEKGVL